MGLARKQRRKLFKDKHLRKLQDAQKIAEEYILEAKPALENDITDEITGKVISLALWALRIDFKWGNERLSRFSHLLQELNGGGRTGNLHTQKKYKLWSDNGMTFNIVQLYDTNIITVDIRKFWKWAKENQHLVNFSKLVENNLGPEPDWVKEKRIHDYKNTNPRRYLPWSKDEENRIVHYIKRGDKAEAIEKATGRTAASINSHFFTAKIPHRVKRGRHNNGGKIWTEEEITLLKKYIEEGKTLRHTAELLNLPFGRVKSYCRYHLDTCNPKRMRAALQKKELHEYRRNNRGSLLATEARQAAMQQLCKQAAKTIIRRHNKSEV